MAEEIVVSVFSARRAADGSPRRKPWVGWHGNRVVARRATLRSNLRLPSMCRPPGCGSRLPITHGSRRGLRALVMVFGQRGVSPLQACALRPVFERACVAARRGGKPREENVQSVTKVNSIRPCRPASLRSSGEARTVETRKPVTLKGSVRKRSQGRWGGWRRNGWKTRHRKPRDLSGSDGVHRSRRRWPMATRTQSGCEEPPGRSQRFHSSVEAG